MIDLPAFSVVFAQLFSSLISFCLNALNTRSVPCSTLIREASSIAPKQLNAFFVSTEAVTLMAILNLSFFLLFVIREIS